MRTEVLFAGSDLNPLLSLVMELGPSTISPTIVESREPVAAVVRHPSEDFEAGIIVLRGSENVADLYELFGSHPRTRFVLLAPAFPPDAALARVATKHGSVFMSRSESNIVVAATVIALMAQTGSLSK